MTSSEAAALDRLRQKMQVNGTDRRGAPAQLGHIRDDPAWAAADQARARYTEAVAAAYGDATASELGRAAALTRAHREVTAAVHAAHRDLAERRKQRIDWLTAQLPLGPGIAEGASDADRAVLQAGFAAALTRARAANPRERQAMLADAERFGDAVTRRAVFTAALDSSDHKTLEAWTSSYAPEVGEHLAERQKLQLQEKGFTGDTEVLFERQGFSVPKAPAEIAELPRLISEHNQAVDTHNSSRYRPPGWQPRRPVDLDALAAVPAPPAAA